MGKDWDRLSGGFSDGKFKGFHLPQTSGGNRNVKCPDCGKWVYDHYPRNCTCGGVERYKSRKMQEWHYQWATELYRVMKPGAHILVFGGTRTYHRMACAVEDAGFEVRDMIEWVYGSGFPKSLDVSKSLDKRNGKEREVISKNPNARDTCGNINICKKNGSGTITAPTTEEAIQWDGFGTGLKPAHEPILLARKPISERNIASNVLKWGTGGLNIDGCRIGNEFRKSNVNDFTNIHSNKYGSGAEIKTVGYKEIQGRFPSNLLLECCCECGELVEGEVNSGGGEKTIAEGITSINHPHRPFHYGDKNGNEKCLIHTNPNCVCRMLDEQSGETKSTDSIRHNNQSDISGKKGIYGKFNNKATQGFLDNGGASRFFKIIKVDQNNSFICNDGLLISEVEKCGNILTKEMGGGMLSGVIREAERYTQDTNQFLCGKKKTENFQKDMKSTILTLIRQMTELKTYNVCREENINYYTEESEKTIRLLMELNTEDARDVKNIRFLLNFKSVLRELIKDIVSNVKIRNYRSGERKTESTITNTCKNITENIERNKSFFYQPKASQAERWFYCTICKKAYPMKERDKHLHNAPEETKYKYLEFHPTQKPESLICYLMRLITPPNGTTIDPFLGSGTAIIAAEREGFNCVGIDSKPEYCEIALRRGKGELIQQKISGEPSTIEKTGF